MIPPYGIFEGYVIKFEVRRLVFENNVESISKYVGAGWMREHAHDFNLSIPTVIEGLICNYCVSCNDPDNE